MSSKKKYFSHLMKKNIKLVFVFLFLFLPLRLCLMADGCSFNKLIAPQACLVFLSEVASG